MRYEPIIGIVCCGITKRALFYTYLVSISYHMSKLLLLATGEVASAGLVKDPLLALASSLSA